MPRVSFHTLGCKLNYAETGTLARDFQQQGFDVVAFGDVADVTVINTCTVTDLAESKCRNAVRRALRANPRAFVIVTGCYAQMRPEDLSAIPGVDLVLGAGEKFHVFDFAKEFTKQDRTQVEVSCIDASTEFGPAFAVGERTRAFLKVQDGCDYTCAFCTIPMARGRSRSQDLDSTIEQAREAAALGVHEIVLTGVNIGLYGQEHGVSFLDLIRRLDEEVPVERFRISSIEPNLLTNEIIAFVAGSRRFQPHFHIPLQSGDDEVLGTMRRRYRRDLYADRVSRIRALMPDAAIGVDVIVGFPTETQEHFENTAAFLSNLDVSYLHVFSYSERPGTAAVEQRDRLGAEPVPAAERARRSRVLRLLSEKKRRSFNIRFIGQQRRVLWEAEDKTDRMFGWTDNYVRVSRPFDDDRVNTIELVPLGEHEADGSLAAMDSLALQIL